MKKIKFISGLLTSVLCASFCFAGAKEPSREKPVDTELVFILDKSGSMHHLTDDTIGSFNSVIEEQKKTETNGNVYVTTVMFSDTHTKIHNRKNLNDISPITRKEYSPGGCTALLDAVGDTINELSNRQKCCNCCKCCECRHCKSKNKVMFVIITDGCENASKEFKKDQVKKLIEDKQTNDKWEFIFLGANIDSVSAAGNIGIDAKYARDFTASSEGIKNACELASRSISQFRENKEIDLDKTEQENKKVD